MNGNRPDYDLEFENAINIASGKELALFEDGGVSDVIRRCTKDSWQPDPEMRSPVSAHLNEIRK